MSTSIRIIGKAPSRQHTDKNLLLSLQALTMLHELKGERKVKVTIEESAIYAGISNLQTLNFTLTVLRRTKTLLLKTEQKCLLQKITYYLVTMDI